jgi:hypothetical protein
LFATRFFGNIVVSAFGRFQSLCFLCRQRPFLSAPLGANFDPQGWCWPPGENVALHSSKH